MAANKVMNMNLLNDAETTQLTELGLKTISEGKMCVILDAAGLNLNQGYPKPRLLQKPKSCLNLTTIEIVLRKLDMIGRKAVSKYGKNFKASREPIMILIMANEYEIESVEDFLVENKYFDYKGIIVLSQSIVPILNTRGKI